MAALISVWMGLGLLLLSLGMVVHRPLLTDATLPIDLYGCCVTLAIAGIVLWAHRKKIGDPAVALQRTQCKAAIGMAIFAAAIVYVLVMFATRVPAPA